MTYAAPGYFSPTYFNAVWRAAALGPKVVSLVVEAVWGEEAAARFLTLSRLPAAESVQAGEEFHRLLALARLISEVALATEAFARRLNIRRHAGEAVQSSEFAYLTRALARIMDFSVEAAEAIDKVLTRFGEALVVVVSSAVWLSASALRQLGMVRRTLDEVDLAELVGIWPTLGRRLVMVLTRAVQATETRKRLRARIKRFAEVIRVSELTQIPSMIIRGMVHSGVRIRALISAALRINKR